MSLTVEQIIQARDQVRALRIPTDKLIVPDRLGFDIAFPTPPIGSTLNPLILPTDEKHQVVVGSEEDINNWIKTAPRRWRNWFLGQYYDGNPEHNLPFHAKALKALNAMENELNGDVLADTFEIPAWDTRLIDIFAIQNDPNLAVQFQRNLIDNGVERAVALSNHLAGQLLVADPEYLSYRQEVYSQIIASSYIRSKIPSGKDLSKKELTTDDMKGLQQAAHEEMLATIDAAAASDIHVVNFFTGSNIWDLFYGFPNPFGIDPDYIRKKNIEAAKRIMPLLEYAAERDVVLALEVHPTEQAYSIETTKAFIKALLTVNENATRRAFRVNLDASHMQNQGIDTGLFVTALSPNGDLGAGLNKNLDPSKRDAQVSWIAHHHFKNARFRGDRAGASAIGDHLNFGDSRLRRDFTSGHLNEPGSVDFAGYYGELARTGYVGLATQADGHYRADSAEWEHAGLDSRSSVYLTLREMARLQALYNGGSGAFDAWK